MACVKVLVALLIGEAVAFRVRHKRSHGRVSLLYTYGAPSLGKPHLKNPLRSDGCFPGRRFWNTNRGNALFGRDEVDIVPQIANIVGYKHPFMEGVELDLSEDKLHVYGCSEETTQGPNGRPKAYLHSRATYSEEASKMDNLTKTISQVGLDVSYTRDEREAATLVSRLGWGLVHTAFHDGSGSISGGPQASHLIQNPQTLECIVTFQGTDTINDWLTDVQILSVDFCGLEGQVHRGFRNHLRRIVKTDIFQANILPFLGSCSSVIATGHSLGGAMATLFTACVNQAPPPGSKGYEEDYKYFMWTEGRASRLPYMKPSP